MINAKKFTELAHTIFHAKCVCVYVNGNEKKIYGKNWFDSLKRKHSQARDKCVITNIEKIANKIEKSFNRTIYQIVHSRATSSSFPFQRYGCPMHMYV